jgi:molybdenum cofactor synthesis domain-containing protein
MVADRPSVRDDVYQLRALFSRWIADPEVRVIISTGGTGITGRDSTPEAVAPLFDKAIDGFGELFRQVSFEEIGASTVQSRAVAGLANGTLIFCLPGSTGACRTAWDQHPRRRSSTAAPSPATSRSSSRASTSAPHDPPPTAAAAPTAILRWRRRSRCC